MLIIGALASLKGVIEEAQPRGIKHPLVNLGTLG
mgnify:FL=1